LRQTEQFIPHPYEEQVTYGIKKPEATEEFELEFVEF